MIGVLVVLVILSEAVAFVMGMNYGKKLEQKALAQLVKAQVSSITFLETIQERIKHLL